MYLKTVPKNYHNAGKFTPRKQEVITTLSREILLYFLHGKKEVEFNVKAGVYSAWSSAMTTRRKLAIYTLKIHNLTTITLSMTLQTIK